MKKLLCLVLLALFPNVQAAAETIDMITINGTGNPVEFVNGYNLDRCLELDRLHKRVEQLDEKTCNGLKNHYTKRAAAEAQARLEAEENRKMQEVRRLELERQNATKEQVLAQREQAYQKDRERIAQLNACEATPAYRLYAAQEAVIEDIEVQQNLRKAVSRQKQLIKMSGVRNLSAERQIAEEQLDVQAALNEHWAEYKSAGGKAASPQAVKHKIEDPCDPFRPES